MKKNDNAAQDMIWTMIEKEKKRDKLVKLISLIAWVVTLVVMVVFLIFTIREMSKTLTLYNMGMVDSQSIIEIVTPPLLVLGGISLVIAILATVGVFLRLRTTSLLEIQQRLANLENMVTAG